MNPEHAEVCSIFFSIYHLSNFYKGFKAILADYICIPYISLKSFSITATWQNLASGYGAIKYPLFFEVKLLVSNKDKDPLMPRTFSKILWKFSLLDRLDNASTVFALMFIFELEFLLGIEINKFYCSTCEKCGELSPNGWLKRTGLI